MNEKANAANAAAIFLGGSIEDFARMMNKNIIAKNKASMLNTSVFILS